MILYNHSQITHSLGPQEVLVGDGAARETGQLAARWMETGEVLLVTDPQLLQLDLVNPVIDSLKSSGFGVEIFGEAIGEPGLEIVERVIEAARSGSWVGVVGMGGGSSLDLAKIGAGAATNDLSAVDFIGVDRLSENPKPMVLIPTTSGTGAEATGVAMINVEGKKRIVNDRRLVPEATILDATLTVSLPAHITAATGLDALSHAVEAFLSRNASPLTEAMSREAVQLISRALPLAFREDSDLDARRAMLYGAHIAGRALSAGVAVGHSIAYTIANRADLSHGITCAMALPFCLAYSLPNQQVAARLDILASEVTDDEVRTGPDFLRWLEQLNEEFEVPKSLKTVGIDEGEVEAMARECLELYPRPTNPVPLELEPLTELYEHLWRGDSAGYADHVLDRERI